jgi:hypothetical protein
VDGVLRKGGRGEEEEERKLSRACFAGSCGRDPTGRVHSGAVTTTMKARGRTSAPTRIAGKCCGKTKSCGPSSAWLASLSTLPCIHPHPRTRTRIHIHPILLAPVPTAHRWVRGMSDAGGSKCAPGSPSCVSIHPHVPCLSYFVLCRLWGIVRARLLDFTEVRWKCRSVACLMALGRGHDMEPCGLAVPLTAAAAAA